VPTAYKFTGQRLDDATGLYYYGARYYDAALGRFVQADTIVPEPGNPQALNRYAYAYNNPLRYTDPMGHVTKDEANEATE
jgi:RHS repeat-associated protein